MLCTPKILPSLFAKVFLIIFYCAVDLIQYLITDPHEDIYGRTKYCEPQWDN